MTNQLCFRKNNNMFYDIKICLRHCLQGMEGADDEIQMDKRCKVCFPEKG